MPSYLDNNNGEGIARMGQSFSNLALQLAIQRQQQEQMRFMNMIRMAEEQRKIALDGIHSKLWEQQGKTSETQSGLNVARTKTEEAKLLQMQGLSKLADNMESNTFAEEMAGVPGYSPQQGAELKDTLSNRLAVANAVKRSLLMRTVAMNPAASASLLTPRSVGQYGSIDSFGRELAPPVPQEEKLYNLAPEHTLMTGQGEVRGQGSERTHVPSNGRSAMDQIIIDAARALMSGKVSANEPDFQAGLEMTNRVSGAGSPLVAPIVTTNRPNIKAIRQIR